MAMPREAIVWTELSSSNNTANFVIGIMNLQQGPYISRRRSIADNDGTGRVGEGGGGGECPRPIGPTYALGP